MTTDFRPPDLQWSSLLPIGDPDGPANPDSETSEDAVLLDVVMAHDVAPGGDSPERVEPDPLAAIRLVPKNGQKVPKDADGPGDRPPTMSRREWKALTREERVALRAQRRELRTQRLHVIHKRRLDEYEMSLQGHGYRSIAEKYGVHWSVVKRDIVLVRQQLADGVIDSIDTMRQRAYMKEELQQKRLWMRITEADTDGKPVLDAEAEALLHATLSRSKQEQNKLYPLYAPTKIASTTPDGQQWAPLALTLQGLTTEQLLVLREVSELRVLAPATKRFDAAAVQEAELVDR